MSEARVAGPLIEVSRSRPLMPHSTALPKATHEIEVRAALVGASEALIDAPIELGWHVPTTFEDWLD